MPCSCQSNGKAQTKYSVTLPTGEKKTYQTEIEAKAAVQRAGGGTIRPV